LTLPHWASVAVRAFDPKLTARLREERLRYAALRARVRPGSSIAVVSAAPRSGCSTVTALLARAFGEYQGDRVLAVDATPSAGLCARLALRAGAMDEVLRALGIRAGEISRDQPGYRWLRSRLDIADGVMLLAGESAMPVNRPPLTENEYPSVIRRLGRWFPLAIVDVDPAYPELLNEALRTADRVVIVAIADEAGLTWLNRALTWIGGADDRTGGRSTARPLTKIVVSVLVQPVPGPALPYAVGTPAFVIPYDEKLRDPGTLTWQALSPETRQAVVALAAALAEPLRAAA
jgi:MinD-like ATPase involved in chromosome partitioning or flagellar assembly